MSLESSINYFYKKYKNLLAILVLVFFMCKVFDYYNTLYEGVAMMGGSIGSVGGTGNAVGNAAGNATTLPIDLTVSTSTYEKLRRKADYVQNQAQQIRRDAVTLRNKLENRPEQSSPEAQQLKNDVYALFKDARNMAMKARNEGEKADQAEALAAANNLLL